MAVTPSVADEQFIPYQADGSVYINIPNTGAAILATPPGLTLRISGKAPFHVEKIVADFSTSPWNTGTDIALGPDHQLANSCGLIINDQIRPSSLTLRARGAADEICFSSGGGHYFFADSTPTLLGVVDTGPKPSADLQAATASGSHSVAADWQQCIDAGGNGGGLQQGNRCFRQRGE